MNDGRAEVYIAYGFELPVWVLPLVGLIVIVALALWWRSGRRGPDQPPDA